METITEQSGETDDNGTDELEDTREFTAEEALALQIYADWCEHRAKNPAGRRADG